MDQDDKIPTFSSELIEKLDKETPVPSLPFTVGSWAALDEAKLRQLSFLAGMRAMVDMLVEWSKEEEDGDDSDTGADGERWIAGRITDSFEKHRKVVSMDLAGHVSAHEPHPGTDQEG